MFNNLEFDKSRPLNDVENPWKNVDTDRFSRSKIIVVYCYS
jgi:hypothetical protein